MVIYTIREQGGANLDISLAQHKHQTFPFDLCLSRGGLPTPVEQGSHQSPSIQMTSHPALLHLYQNTAGNHRDLLPTCDVSNSQCLQTTEPMHTSHVANNTFVRHDMARAGLQAYPTSTLQARPPDITAQVMAILITLQIVEAHKNSIRKFLTCIYSKHAKLSFTFHHWARKIANQMPSEHQHLFQTCIVITKEHNVLVCGKR